MESLIDAHTTFSYLYNIFSFIAFIETSWCFNVVVCYSGLSLIFLPYKIKISWMASDEDERISS